MVFEVKIDQDKAEIVKYVGSGSAVIVPENIEGRSVTALGPYTFSEHGKDLREVILPDTVRRIGRYAFYGCANLQKIVLTDTLQDIGGGVFTGCRIREIEVDLYHGRKCCLRDIVAENRFCLSVTLRYHTNGKEETARLIFPEHYEEAVENTPARIVMTEYHGSGGNYRQCIYNKEVDYKRYDEMFVYARAREEKETVFELVFSRLLFPYQLSEEAKERYEGYVRANVKEAAAFLIVREWEKGIFYLTESNLWTEEGLNVAIDFAAEKRKTEFVSFLMEEKHKRYKAKPKLFEW